MYMKRESKLSRIAFKKKVFLMKQILTNLNPSSLQITGAALELSVIQLLHSDPHVPLT